MPSITGVSRTVIPNGRNRVVLTGSGFTGATRVYFRDPKQKQYDAAEFNVDSDTQITSYSPRVDNIGT